MFLISFGFLVIARRGFLFIHWMKSATHHRRTGASMFDAVFNRRFRADKPTLILEPLGCIRILLPERGTSSAHSTFTLKKRMNFSGRAVGADRLQIGTSRAPDQARLSWEQCANAHVPVSFSIDHVPIPGGSLVSDLANRAVDVSIRIMPASFQNRPKS